MKQKKLSWGLLGTGRINQAIIPPLHSSRRNQLVGVASREETKAREYAQEYQIPRAYGSYEAMLADPEIDVVYNSLPNSLHSAWTVKAARAGKHVLCEKPIALSLAELDAMAQAAQENGVLVAEAFMYRHHPMTLEVQRLVREGIVGKVHVVRGSFSFSLQQPEDVRWNPELGGGSLWDIGCYPVSYTRALLGQEPLEVFGRQVSTERGVDASFVGEMRFPDDVLAHFDSSFATPWVSVMEIIGSLGRLTIETPFHPGKATRAWLWDGEEKKRLRLPVSASLYGGEVEDMAQAVLDGAPQRLSLAESRANLATLLALYQSARTGQPVRL